MSDHTPLPWSLGTGDKRKENRVANVRGIDVWGPYAAAPCGVDAAFIVKAVNSHEELLVQAKEVVEWAKMFRWYADGERTEPNVAVRGLEAAIAHAEGRQP